MCYLEGIWLFETQNPEKLSRAGAKVLEATLPLACVDGRGWMGAINHRNQFFSTQLKQPRCGEAAGFSSSHNTRKQIQSEELQDVIPLYLTCLKIPESGRISWRIKVSSGKHGVCPKKPNIMTPLNSPPCKAHLIPSDVPWPLMHT